MDARCRISLLGELRVEQDGRAMTRFRTRKFGLLLAYLACYLQRSHPRDELIEMLWPECDPDVGRDRLSTALSSLRRQLEPPGVPAGAIIVADRFSVRLNPASVATDVWEFEAGLEAAARAEPAGRVGLLQDAIGLYRGPLLPGFYDDWVLGERRRLSQACVQALRTLGGYLEQEGDLAGAIECAQRAVSAEPLREDLHCELMRLYAAAGQPSAALAQFHILERILKEELEAAPSIAAVRLSSEIEASHYKTSGQWPVVGGRQSGGRRPAASGRNAKGPTPNAQRRASGPGHPNLPLQFTRFFGREEEIGRLCKLIVDGRWLMVDGSELPSTINHRPSTRLLTLTGPGGSGKTRLALEVAERCIEPYAGSVFFAPLADLADPSRIPDAILTALRLPRAPEQEPLAQALEWLSHQPTLLILDNFEHLVEGADLVHLLIERAATLTCLVTSRQALGFSLEREWPVRPLPVPVEGQWWMVDRPDSPSTPPAPRVPDHQLSTLATCASVQLFLDRAQAVRSDFQITPHNAAAVAELCTRLEGIPLAIELAAARAQVLTPAQMLAQLEHRLDFLVSRKRDAIERHQSLRAAIEWSYRLLSPELQRFFRSLSVFRGGWTLEAAGAVAGGGMAGWWGSENGPSPPPHHPPTSWVPATPPPAILDTLEHLRSTSLVRTEETSGEMRYRMLETVREYAAEKLREVGEETIVRERHLDWCLDLAEQAGKELDGPGQQSWLNRLELEHDNLRAALSWSVSAGGSQRSAVRGQGSDAGSHTDAPSPNAQRRTPNALLRLAGALGRFWYLHGHLEEGRRWLALALAAPGETTALERAAALRAAGLLAWQQGDYTVSRAAYEESLALSRALSDPGGMAGALTGLGMVALNQDDFPGARGFIEEALVLHRQAGRPAGEAANLAQLGHIARNCRELEKAADLYDQALRLQRQLGHRLGEAGSLQNLGLLAYWQGDYGEAGAFFESGLRIFRELGNRITAAELIADLARVARAEERFAEAGALVTESLTTLRQVGDRRELAGALALAGNLACELGNHRSAAELFEEARRLYRDLGLARFETTALLLLAETAFHQGAPERALAFWGEGLARKRELADHGGIAEAAETLAFRLKNAGPDAAEGAVRLLGAAAALRQRTGRALLPGYRRKAERHLLALRGSLGDQQFEAAWEIGASDSVEDTLRWIAGQRVCRQRTRTA